MKIKPLFIVLAVMAAGIIGWQAGLFSPNESAAQVLYRSMINNQEHEYASGDMNLTFQTLEGREATDIGSFAVSFRAITDEEVLENNKMEFSFDGGISLEPSSSPFSKLDLAGTVLFSGRDLYIKATKLPLIPIFDPSTIKDIWWKLDFVELGRQFGGDEKAQEIEDYFSTMVLQNKEQKTEIFNLMKEHKLITSVRFSGTEDIDGKMYRKITFSINEQGFSNFIEAYMEMSAERQGVELSGSESEAIEELFSMMDFSPMTVLLSEDDEVIHGMSGSITVTDSSTGEKIQVAFDGTYDYETPVVIQEPKDSMPIESLLQQFLPAF